MADSEYKLLSSHKGQVSITVPYNVIIEDPKDCDMVFTFKIDVDKEQVRSYTKYNPIDPGHGEIIVYNIKGANTISIPEPIEIGTYKKSYRLFTSFIIKVVSERYNEIQVLFLLKDL